MPHLRRLLTGLPWSWAPLLLAGMYGAAMWETVGEYHPGWIAATFTVFLACAPSFLWRTQPVGQARAEKALSLLCVFFYGLLVTDPKTGIHQDPWALAATAGMLVLAGLGLMWMHLPYHPRLGFWVACLALVEAHLLSLVVTPNPDIDTFVCLDRACLYSLQGVNPYAATYPDIYAGLYGYPAGMHYPPGLLLAGLLSQVGFGDVRVGLLAGQMACAGLLAMIAVQAGWSRRGAQLVAIVVLLFPSSMRVAVQTWCDPLQMAFILAALWLWRRERYTLGGVSFGLALAIKQTALVPAYATLCAFLYWNRLRPWSVRTTAVAVGTASALCLPWLLADPAAFLRSNTEVFRHPLRPDAFTLVNLARHHGLAPRLPIELGFLLGGLGALATLASILRTDRWRAWSGGTTLLLGLIFYFGKQAFCNYYHYLTYWLVLHVVLCLEVGE